VPGICARARLKRRAPARAAAAWKNRAPCPAQFCSAALQRLAPARAAAQGPARCAPPPRARWRAQRPCSGGRPAPRYEMGTPGVPGPPRCKLSRWPAGRRGRGAGAAAQAPASSGSMLASISVGQVWVAARSDAPCVCMCARGRGNALFEHVFRSCGCHRGAVGLKSSSKDCTACLLQCCTPRHWQPRTCVGGGAFAL